MDGNVQRMEESDKLLEFPGVAAALWMYEANEGDFRLDS